jgi:hypothetical protein
LTLTHLERVANALLAAKEAGSFAYIAVTIPNVEDAEERIVFPPHAIDTKVEYINAAYQPNGIHKGCKQIRIVEAGRVERMDFLPTYHDWD